MVTFKCQFSILNLNAFTQELNCLYSFLYNSYLSTVFNLHSLLLNLQVNMAEPTQFCILD